MPGSTELAEAVVSSSKLALGLLEGGKVGTTVENFKALVEAAESAKRDQGNNETNFGSVFKADTGLNMTSGMSSSFANLLSNELLSKLKKLSISSNSSTFSGKSLPSDMELLPSATLGSMMTGGNDSYSAFDLAEAYNSNLTDLTGLKETLGGFKQSLDDSAQLNVYVTTALIVIYALIIVIGVLGNILILWAVLGREAMRTARNVFIATLAASDLFLCIITMPSSLWEVLYKHWPFGPETELLCRLASAGQATPIFMSSMTISAIAMDRYRCIMQPDKQELTVRWSVAVSVTMAILSMIMSIPLFEGFQLKAYVIFVSICTDTRSPTYRLAYNMSSCFVQFILPLLIVFTVYASIYFRLRIRPRSQHMSNNRRRRRTNVTIVLVTLIFFLSWLPHNTLTMMLEFSPNFVDMILGQGRNIHALVYGLCRVLGLANACINPVLYGYLNENFRKEYEHIFQYFPWHRISHRNANPRSKNGRMHANNVARVQREVRLSPRQPYFDPIHSVARGSLVERKSSGLEMKELVNNIVKVAAVVEKLNGSSKGEADQEEPSGHPTTNTTGLSRHHLDFSSNFAREVKLSCSSSVSSECSATSSAPPRPSCSVSSYSVCPTSACPSCNCQDLRSAPLFCDAATQCDSQAIVDEMKRNTECWIRSNGHSVCLERTPTFPFKAKTLGPKEEGLPARLSHSHSNIFAVASSSSVTGNLDSEAADKASPSPSVTYV